MENYETPPDDENYESDETSRVRLEEKMNVIVGSLDTLAQEQVRKKTNIENRWLLDLTQFHGKYDADMQSKLKDAGKSSIFVNYTRNKTNSWEARLSDMLFPTDDKNWGIKPTPIPELAMAMKGGNQEAAAILAEAETRSKGMELEITDQLVESNYNVKARDAIHDGVVLGTGVMKGPTTSTKMRQVWAIGESGEQELTDVPDAKPDWSRVDPWNYFPDMNARRQDECEFEFERHLKNKKQMRQLAKQPGFDKDAIREVLQEEAKDSMPDYIQSVKSIVDDGQSIEPKYHVWEYHGAIDGGDLKNMCECLGKEEYLEDFDGDDPLKEIRVIIWFCNNKILKFGMHPLDSGDSLYSVFNLQKDESSVFGFGVPYMMRDSQKSLNGAWRMIMDNSALSTGPQIVVNKDIIEPSDNSWNLTPRKIWFARLKNGQGMDHAFKSYTIEGHQNELIQVINLAKQFADDETNLPLVAQGESGGHQTQTSGGMSMLMNSVNVVFRRVVKNFDDDMTTKNIRRQYDFNMQFSDKEHIKGDYEVDARGSSVLLVREVQTQNLLVIAERFTNHPVLGPLTKTASVYRQLAQSQMLAADSVVKTDEEIAADAEKAAQQPPPPDPEAMKLEMQMQLAQMDGQLKLQIEEMKRETIMMEIAEKNGIKYEELQSKYAIAKGATDSKERMVAAEIGVKKQMGEGI